MAIRNVLVFLSLFISFSFNSCKNEDDDGGLSKRANQENVIVKKVFSNTKGVPITLQSLQGGLIIKDSWETSVVTKDSFAQLVATCEDKDVLITGEIYVNGVLKAQQQANKYLSMTIQIK
jgi:hypothetical protein